MATKIVTKNSSTASAVPTASDLVQGELAVNVADKRLFTEDNAGAIVELGTNPYNFTANHNGSAKLATTSTGIDVTGTATMDGLEIGDNQWIYAGNGADLKIGHDGTDNIIRAQGSPLYIDANGTTFRGYSPYTKHMDIASNGDISFYEDTGTTPKFFWDASAESLGIGTSSPSVKLDVISSNQVVSNFAHPSTSTAAVNGGAIVRIQNTNATNGNQSSLIFADSTASASSGIFGYNTNHSTHEGYMVFGTRNSGGSFAERMRIFSTGQVAINNTVASSMDGGANNLVIGSGSGTEGMTIYSGTANSGTIYFADGSSGDDRFRGQINYAHSDNSLNFRTNASSAPNMTIDSSGNVGIGTTSISAKLHIAGSPQATTGALAFLRNGDATSSNTSFGGIHFSSSPGTDFSIGKSNVNSTTTLSFRNGNTGASYMDIDASGQVGIGETSPDETLHVSGGGIKVDGSATIASGSGAGLFLDYGSNIGGITALDQGVAWKTLRLNASDHQFYIAGGEKMRIDSSGNLLVGTTDTNPADNGAGGDAGHAIAGTGYIASSRSGDTVALFNRMDNDGDIVDFRKDGSIVGSIGVSGTNAYIDSQGGTLKISTVGTERYNFDLDQIYPSVDNDTNLGLSSKRFKDLYLSGGVYLGGTGSANKLDDYEEGTWTPTVYGTTTTGTASYTQRVGTYTKVGNLAYVQAYVIFNSFTGGGAIRISGLPFTPESGAYENHVGSIIIVNMPLPSNTIQINPRAIDGQTYIDIQATLDNAGYTPLLTDTAGEMIVSVTYRTA